MSHDESRDDRGKWMGVHRTSCASYITIDISGIAPGDIWQGLIQKLACLHEAMTWQVRSWYHCCLVLLACGASVAQQKYT